MPNFCPYCGATEEHIRRILSVSNIPKKKMKRLFVCYACESFFIYEKVLEIPGTNIDIY